MEYYVKEENGKVKIKAKPYDEYKKIIFAKERVNEAGVPENYKVDEAGKITLKTAEEIAAELAPKIAAQALEDLYQRRTAKQNETCDANFFALLMAIRASIEPTPTKAKACLDWLDLLWLSEDPESLGDCPHKFLEVRTEAESV